MQSRVLSLIKSPTMIPRLSLSELMPSSVSTNTVK